MGVSLPTNFSSSSILCSVALYSVSQIIIKLNRIQIVKWRYTRRNIVFMLLCSW